MCASTTKTISTPSDTEVDIEDKNKLVLELVVPSKQQQPSINTIPYRHVENRISNDPGRAQARYCWAVGELGQGSRYRTHALWRRGSRLRPLRQRSGHAGGPPQPCVPICLTEPSCCAESSNSNAPDHIIPEVEAIATLPCLNLRKKDTT